MSTADLVRGGSRGITSTLRAVGIARVLLRHRLDDFLRDTAFRRWLWLLKPITPAREAANLPRGQRLRHALQELGPIFVKFGQVLSTRRDLLPPDIAEELTLLQDRVAPFPGEDARALVEAALGRPVSEVYAEFDLTPLASVKSSPEGRLRQTKSALRESYRAGNRHVLVIEEAHSLPITTLNHLKRFLEVEDGFSRVLSIILIGQNELREKLNENDPRVREVVQRCELIELPPLDSRLEDYIKFKFDRAGKPMAEVVDQGAIDMLRTRLTNSRANAQRRSGDQTASLLHPLAVNNLLTACMNLAAEIGAPKVTADVVKEV